MSKLKPKFDEKHAFAHVSKLSAIAVRSNQHRAFLAVLFDSRDRQRSCTPLRLPEPAEAHAS